MDHYLDWMLAEEEEQHNQHLDYSLHNIPQALHRVGSKTELQYKDMVHHSLDDTFGTQKRSRGVFLVNYMHNTTHLIINGSTLATKKSYLSVFQSKKYLIGSIVG